MIRRNPSLKSYQSVMSTLSTEVHGLLAVTEQEREEKFCKLSLASLSPMSRPGNCKWACLWTIFVPGALYSDYTQGYETAK